MSTRISSNMLYEAGMTMTRDAEALLFKLSQQSQKKQRLLNPSDDPLAWANVRNVEDSRALNKQFDENRRGATAVLTQTESTLRFILDSMNTAKSNAIAANNSSCGEDERANIATQLKGTYNLLLSYANTQDIRGGFLFAGYKRSQPFVDGGLASVSYNGDQGVQMLQVDTGRSMAVSFSGQEIFQSQGMDVFKTVRGLIDLLQTPDSSAADLTEATNSQTVYDTAYDLAITNRTSSPTPPTRVEIEAAKAAATADQVREATSFATLSQQAHDTDYTRTDFTPGSAAARTQALIKYSNQIEHEIKHFNRVVAQVGSDMAELRELDDVSSSKNLQYQSTLNTLLGCTEADIKSIISDFQRQETYVKLADEVSSRMARISLLNLPQ